LSSFEELSAHLHRQDRLIAAGEKAKEGFRKTIQKQKERIEQLEARLKELEGK
jgi:septal ring factor EnvC (AmiA/AmiB activator)